MSLFNWQGLSSGVGYTSPKAVKGIIIINVVVFILINLFPGFSWGSFFGFIPLIILTKLMIWQLVTYLFLHAGLWHLVINMLMLWFFGPTLEYIWGRKRFLLYFFLTGSGAGLCSIAFSIHSSMPVLGASGAIFGILVAYAMMFPENIILLFFIFPMKMKHAIAVLAGINLLAALSSSGNGIVYLAQLGGGLFGYLYLKSEEIGRQLAYFNLSNLKAAWLKKKAVNKQRELNNLDQQVDMILDKISRQGIKSLTREERKILERKSKMN